MENKYMSQDELEIKKMSNLQLVRFYPLGEYKEREILGLMVFYKSNNKMKILNYCSIDKLFPYLVRQVLECYKEEKNDLVFDNELTREIIKNGLKLDNMIDSKHFENKLYSVDIMSITDIYNIKDLIQEELKFIFSLIGDNVNYGKVSGYQNRFTINMIRNNKNAPINGIMLNKDDFEYQFCINGVFEEAMYLNINFLANQLKINWHCPKRNVSGFLTYDLKKEHAISERMVYIDGKLSFYDKKVINYQEFSELSKWSVINNNNIGTKGIMIAPNVYILVKRVSDNNVNMNTIKTAFLFLGDEEALIKETGYKDYSKDQMIVKLNEYAINTRILLEDEFGLVEYRYYPCALGNGNYKNIAGKSSYQVFLTDKESLTEIESFPLQSINDIDIRYDNIYECESYKKKLGRKK